MVKLCYSSTSFRAILPKISPPTLLLHLSLLSLTLTAIMMSLLFLKLNSFLKPSVTTLPWTILGIFLILIPPPTHLCLLFKFFLMMFSMPFLASTLRRLMDLMEYLLSFLKNCASVLTLCLVNIFRLCLSTFTIPSCWKYAFKQPVPKKDERSNPSNNRPIALLSCLSKAFESILNLKIQKHLSTSDLLSDRQYGFRKGRSTGDLLSLLTDSWSSSLSRFGKTFSVALDISKAFDRIWHKSLLSKLPSFGFYPSLCSFISSFLSGRSISAVVDGQCLSPKPINSGVPQDPVLSPTHFLLFINDLLSVTNCPIHSYADDSTLHFSTSSDRKPTLQELQDSRMKAAERLTSDLAIIFDWGGRNLESFNASKTQFLHLSTRHNLPNSCPLFFDNKQVTLNILGLSNTQNLKWKLYISLTKSAPSKLGVLYLLRQCLSPAQLMSIYRGLVRTRMEYASLVWGGSTHTALLERVESKALRLISSPSSTDNLLPLKSRRQVASLSILYRYFHSDCSSELANYMPLPSRGLAAPAFPLKLIPLLSKSLMLELTSIFTPSSLLLVNSGTTSLYLRFPLPTNWILSRGECQDISPRGCDLSFRPLPWTFIGAESRGLFYYCYFSNALKLYPVLLKKKSVPGPETHPHR